MGDQRKFNKGDVVRLYSDNTLMTVVEYVKNDDLPVVNLLLSKEEAASLQHTTQVYCEWIYEGRQESGRFNEDSLELVSGESIY